MQFANKLEAMFSVYNIVNSTIYYFEYYILYVQSTNIILDIY